MDTNEISKFTKNVHKVVFMNCSMKYGLRLFIIVGIAFFATVDAALHEPVPEPGSFLQSVADGEAEPVIVNGKAWTFHTPPPPENERVVRADHPRLYLTTDNLPGMREKLNDPIYAELMGNIRSRATNHVPGTMLYSAFMYQITQDPTWAETTKQILLDNDPEIPKYGTTVEASSIYGTNNKTVGTDGKAYKYEPVFAFDWIMDTLTQDEKVQIFENIKSNFNYDHRAVPLDKRNEWYFNDFWRSDAMFYSSLAFAVHGEGIDDAWADEIIAIAYDEDDPRVVGPYGPNRGAGFLDVLMSGSLDSGGFSPMGSTYDTYWSTGMYAMAFWESATQEPLFDRTLMYKKYPEVFLTSRNGLLVGRKITSRQMLLEYFTGIYQGDTAALSKYLSDLYGRSPYALVYRAIFGDLRVQGKSPAELNLPTAKYNRGDHTFYSKDSWGDDAISLMVRSIYLDVARYTGNEGLFSIYKGDKPIAPRVYNSKNPPSPGLHSGIWIYDPEVITDPNIAFGRRKITHQTAGAYWSSGKANEAIPAVTESHFNVGGPKLLEITDKYRAISMESGSRYDYVGVSGHIVNTAQRTIIHIPDGDRNYILVYDYLDVDPALKSAWQMRLMDVPSLDGSQFGIPGLINGTVVSPANHTLEWLGGDGLEFVGPSPEREWYSKERDGDTAGYSVLRPHQIPSLGLGNIYIQPEGQRDNSTAPFIPQVEYLVALEVSELDPMPVKKISEREVSFDRWRVRFAKDGSYSILENDVPVNRPPVLQPIPDIAVNAGDTIDLHPIANDANGDQLSFSYSGWISSPNYQTSIGDLGEHRVNVTVSDGSLTDSQTVIVLVKDPDANHAPTLNPIPDITVLEGEVINLTPSAGDADNDQLTYSYAGWMTTSSRVTTHTDVGSHRVIVTVSDGELYDSQEVTVTVLAIDSTNHAPVLETIADIVVHEGEMVVITPLANDIDADQLAYTYSGWMTGERYTTTQSDIGTHSVVVTVSDGELTDSQVVSITVLGNVVVDPPVIGKQPVSQRVAEGRSVTLSVEATGVGLTYQWTKEGVAITAATSPSYTIASATLQDQGAYRVVVTNAQGASATSDNALITVNMPAYRTYSALCAAQGGVGCRNFDSVDDILELNEVAVPGSPNRPLTNSKCRWNGGNANCYPVFDGESCTLMDSLGPRSQNSLDDAKRWSPCYDIGQNAARLTFWNDLYSGIQQLKAAGPELQAGTDQVWTQYELKLSPEFFFEPEGSTLTSIYALGRLKTDACKSNYFAQHTIFEMTPQSVTVGPNVSCVSGDANGSQTAYSIGKSRANHWLRVTTHYDVANSGIYFWIYDLTSDELLTENYIGSYNGNAVSFLDSSVDITDLTFRNYSGSHKPNTAKPSPHYWVRNAIVTTEPVTPQADISITLHPASQSIEERNSLTLSVEASGSGLTYQWTKDGIDIVGAISSSYTIDYTTLEDQGTYSVVVTNAQGVSVTSYGAVITVTKPVYQTYVELCADQAGAGCRNFDSVNDILELNEMVRGWRQLLSGV
ncbi:MAG: immunoglobulin domain-containing protein [Candidatus Thiodiazotropha sp.]